MRIDRYIIMLLAIVMMAGCSSPFEEGTGGEEQSGSLLMSVDMTRSGATSTSDDLLESAALRIFNSQGGLVRYYKDLREDVIDYLAVGSYRARLVIGEPVYATFNAEEVSYDGECDIEIEAQRTTDVTLDVTMQNTVASIVLDETLASHYTGYYLCVYVANGVADITDETLQLKYTESGDGYFIVDGDVENLVWQFCSDNGVEAQGVIEGAERAHQYKLTLKYSDYLDVSDMTISIEGEETHDDILGFKPQPVIKGAGFDISDIQNYEGGDYTVSVKSLSDITSISTTVGAQSYTLGVDSELSYDVSTNILTMSSDMFDAISQGGVNDVVISAYDSNNSEGHATMKVGIAGFIGTSNEDFWYNTATISWYATTPASQVEMKYRRSGESVWSSTTGATTTDGGHTWSAKTVVDWTSSKNAAGLTTYQLKSGHTPSAEYEYQMIADGGEPKVATYTSSAVAQSESTTPPSAIPTVSDSELTCYTPGNVGAPFWASGNNGYSSTLCSYDSPLGTAVLDSQSIKVSIATAFAAGNLFSGVFQMLGNSGSASFGQEYNWVARPKSLKFSYKVNVGSGDRGRVFIAIVDWKSRRSVTTDSGGDASGSWEPTSMTSVTEGKIIGYGSVFFDNNVSSMTNYELPIYYYDTEAKPTPGNYTIAISCSASWDGEHLKGSADSKLWLKDFKFEY